MLKAFVILVTVVSSFRDAVRVFEKSKKERWDKLLQADAFPNFQQLSSSMRRIEQRHYPELAGETWHEVLVV